MLAGRSFSVLPGTTIRRFDAEGVEPRRAPRTKLTQQYRFAHGGVLGYLADSALAFAAAGVLDRAVVTFAYTVNWLRTALGEMLIERLSVPHADRR